MASSTPRPADDDEPLSDADRAALERAAAEPGFVMTADEFAALLSTGGDDEVRELIAAGRVAEAIGLARFNIAEATYNWDEPRNRPLLDPLPEEDWMP